MKNETVAQPQHLWIEPTNKCNTRCIHCGHYYSDFGMDMDAAVYESIKENVLPHLSRVSLIGYGEPFVSRSFPAMFEDCYRRGLVINITTNGIMLKNKALVEELVKHKVNLTVSVDGATKEAYEFVRPFIKWESLLSSLDALKDARDAFPNNDFHLSFNFVAMKKTIADLPALVRLAAKYNAGCIDVLPLGAYDELEKIKGQSLVDAVDLEEKYFQQARQVADELGIKLVLPVDYSANTAGGVKNHPLVHAVSMVVKLLKNRDWRGIKKGILQSFGERALTEPVKHPCFFPWRDSYVASDGSVLPCCILGASLGNMKESAWSDIWNGFKYRNLRRTIHGWNPVKVCRYCPLPAGINAGDAGNYTRYFDSFKKRELDMDSKILRMGEGCQIVVKQDGSSVMHMAQNAVLTIINSDGIRFLRLSLDQESVSDHNVISGCCMLNNKKYYFDNSCSEIHIPLSKKQNAMEFTLSQDPDMPAMGHGPHLVISMVSALS